MNKRQLQQAKAAALAAAKALQTASDGRLMTAEEQTAFEGYIATAEARENDLKQLERLEALERTAPAVTSMHNRAEDKPWSGLGDQLHAIATSQTAIVEGRGHLADPRIKAALGSSEIVPSDGGFLVDPEFGTDLLQKIYDVGEIAKRVAKVKMNSSRLVINAVDEQSRVDGSRWGGVLGYWLAEANTYTSSKPKFDQRQLIANKLVGLVYATEEVLEDTAMLESYVNDAVPQELGFKTDAAIFNGTGAGQPLGVLNAPATVQQAIVSGETSISATDILAMWSRAPYGYRKNAVWFINQALEPVLYPLQVGSPSLGQYLIYTPPGMNGNTSGTALMMGRPVIPIEQASAPGVVGDITLFCPEGYLFAQRNEVRADSSIHVAFLTGEKAFRFMLRLDGQPWWKQPLQPFYATGATAPPTLSPFVTLGARSAD